MAFFTVPSYNVHPKGPRSQPGKGLGKNQRKNGYTLVKYPGFLLGFNDGSYFIKWELMGFQSWTNYGKSSKICQNMFIFKKIGIVYMWLGYGACWLVHVFSKRHVFEQNIAKHQKHCIWAMVIHPILGTITMDISNPIDGCMTIPFYEKTNHVFTTAHLEHLVHSQFILHIHGIMSLEAVSLTLWKINKKNMLVLRVCQ